MLKTETESILRDAVRIAALRMELIEEMNGLGPVATDERFYRVTERGDCDSALDPDDDNSGLEPAPELVCNCDRDPLGPCESCEEFGMLSDEGEAAIWNETLTAALQDLPDQSLYRVVFGLCLTCGSDENMRDSGECWPCYDIRSAESEMFAKHGGDV